MGNQPFQPSVRPNNPNGQGPGHGYQFIAVWRNDATKKTHYAYGHTRDEALGRLAANTAAVRG